MSRNLLAIQISALVVSSTGVPMGWFSFLNSTSAQAEEKNWSVKMAEAEGTVLSIRKNESAGTKKNRSTYTARILFKVPFHSSDKDGRLPEKEQSEVNMIEDSLTNRLEKDGNAVYVLAVRSVGFQHFVFYAKEPFVKKNAFDKVLKEIKSHKVQYLQASDPKWSMYDDM